VQAVAALVAISGGAIAWLQYHGQREARRDDTHAQLLAEAFAGLHAEGMETRVGALFLLSRLADLSVSHRPAAAQMMVTFVGQKRRKEIVGLPEEVPADVQTALSLLTRHPARWYGVPRFTLAGLALRRVDLAGARLDGTDERGTRAAGADLTGTHLEDATLDRAHLEGADLTGAALQDAHLVGARLDGATLVDTQLFGADVTGWVLTGARYHDVAWPWKTDDATAVANAEAAGARPFDPPFRSGRDTGRGGTPSPSTTRWRG